MSLISKPSSVKFSRPRRSFGLIPHDQPDGPLRLYLAAFWQQMLPIVPVQPTAPTAKCCNVCKLAYDILHGMEEVIGSMPISRPRCTRPLLHICDFGITVQGASGASRKQMMAVAELATQVWPSPIGESLILKPRFQARNLESCLAVQRSDALLRGPNIRLQR